MKNRRDLEGLKNIVFEQIGIEKIQVLKPVKSIADIEGHLSSKNAFINQWAIPLKVGEALSLDRFLRYCKSNSCSFAISDVITLNDFKNYSTYTLKAVTTGRGLKKVIDGVNYFFCIYRQIDDGRIMGAWLPYDKKMDKILNIKFLLAEDVKKAKEKRERKQLEVLLKKYQK